MEPALDHTLEILTTEQCWDLLAGGVIGRIGFVADGEVIVLPVTYTVEGHSVVFRTDEGQKLYAAAMNQPVSFEVDDWDADAKAGWSVLIKGMGDQPHLTEAAELDRLGLEPWAEPERRQSWVRIVPEEITGRVIRTRP